MTVQAEYFKRSTADVSEFVDSLKTVAVKEGGVFDSAASTDFLKSAINQKAAPVPTELQVVYDEAGTDEKKARISRAILDGVKAYESAHAMPCPADVVESAIHQAYSTTKFAHDTYALQGINLDAVPSYQAESLHGENLSLQPNRAVVSIITTIAEAIPFAHYLPADIGSNEARLAILCHKAGSDFGSYKVNDILDGVQSGKAYVSASRIHTVNPEGGACEGKITAVQDTENTCDQEIDGVPLMRGRTIVYVDGEVAAEEARSSSGSGASAISGEVWIEGTKYTISGTIDTDTGEFSLTSSPELPETVEVAVEGFIDYERKPEITPLISSWVDVFQLYAKPWHAHTRQSIDSRTQLSNELGLDPLSESIIAVQTQFTNERHFEALAKGMRLASKNTETFDFDAHRQVQDGPRGEVWRDLAAPLEAISQLMAVRTINHGVTHLYVGRYMASELRMMRPEFFEPSGITARPSIYRLGRLFGMYEVYYTPRIVEDGVDSAQILCVGRATDVGRNPIVLGDAVAPTVIPLAINADLRQGAGFYARNFTAVNPHKPSSMGFGLIEVTNKA